MWAEKLECIVAVKKCVANFPFTNLVAGGLGLDMCVCVHIKCCEFPPCIFNWWVCIVDECGLRSWDV